jgi:hypothetical protein
MVVLVGFTSSAAAGTIALSAGIRAQLAGERLAVEVELANAGDQVAEHVQGRIEVAGLLRVGPAHPRLAQDQRLVDRFAFDLAGRSPGDYPIVLQVHYADANAYPFTALATAIFRLGAAPETAVTVRWEPSDFELAGVSSTALELANLSGRHQRARIRVVAPRELRVKPERTSLALAARARSRVPVELANLSALAGSRYPLFAVVEWQDRRHGCVIAQAWIDIGEPTSAIARARFLVYLALALLALTGWRVARRRRAE